METIPVGRLHHVNVIVRDLERVAKNYAEVLGITGWDVTRRTVGRLAETSVHGFAAPFAYDSATGSNPRGVTFRLIEPTEGFSTFAEFLLTRGPGVHGLCASVMTAAAFEELCGVLGQVGIKVAQTATVGDARQVFLDTREALGGFFLEVEVTPSGEPASVSADEHWDFSDEVSRPAGVEVTQHIPKIAHFGVAVRELSRKLPRFSELLGLQSWNSVHFHPTPGSLEYSTLNGAEVKHAFLLATAGFDAFGFEVLQGLSGPTHYREEFIDRIGEGIHHMLLLPGLSREEWWPVRAWMESLDIPVVMSGRVRFGAAEFFYLDTREKLGGYLVEAIVRAPGEAAAERPKVPLGAFSFDFSHPVASPADWRAV